MGPLPKRKHSLSRKNKRRAHDALTLKKLVRCPNCGELQVSHHVCANCGQYRGVQVLEAKDDTK